MNLLPSATPSKHQKEQDKEARRLIKIAFQTGGTVPFDLKRLIELKTSLKVIKAVYKKD